MSTVSTHVLDAVRGKPAVGIEVVLEYYHGAELGRASTGFDGRIASFGHLPAGEYRLIFHTGRYFTEREIETFYPEVVIVFSVGEDEHAHVPLLLSPHSFTTYRGS